MMLLRVPMGDRLAAVHGNDDLPTVGMTPFLMGSDPNGP